MAQSAVDVALKKFIAITDRISQFEANINTPGAPETECSQYMWEVHRDQIQALWEKVEKTYESCSALLAVSDDNTATSTVLESKYSYCYSVYSRCTAQLRQKIASQSTQASANVITPLSTGCRLPPVDTEVFAGDYLRWPTFRDLFTAIYIQSSRLTPVEKLFHLLSKTSGDAHAIVSKAPLTHEGFVAAWQSLTDRFENRRLLANSQDPPLKARYDSVIQEYIDLGHMTEVSPASSSATYYLPHHAVVKPESTTTKVRVVFNASSPSANGISLNDILFAGPVLQSDLTIQILK
ncbi:hypothetical protein KR032_012158, partial [Drosophila birchii]